MIFILLFTTEYRVVDTIYVVTGNTMEFTHDQYEECCSAVEEWSRENDKPVMWSFLPGKSRSNRRYWENYVRDGDTFTLVMSPEKLIGVVTRNGKIRFAYDNMDRNAG